MWAPCRFRYYVVDASKATPLIIKPRKIKGGYIDNFGHRYVGRDIELITRYSFNRQTHCHVFEFRKERVTR